MNQSLRLLSIEDQEADTELLMIELRQRGFHPSVKRIETRFEMNQALDEGHWDVILADHTLPGFDSFSALSLLKEKALDIPFIVVSGTLTDALVVKALKSGAQDFISKSNLNRLAPAIERSMEEAAIRRKLAKEEKARIKTEERFRQIFIRSNDAIFVINPRTDHILEVNPKACAILGFREEELLNKKISEICGDNFSAFRLFSKSVLKVGEGWTDQLKCRAKDGCLIPVELSASVIDIQDKKCLLVLARDISERKQQEEQLYFQAHYDALTGLPNRSLLLERLSQSIKHARRKRCKAALLFVDLDRFKQINDTFGHLVGDDILRQVAEGLRSCIREMDTVARSGGDEFLIAMSEISGRKPIEEVAKKVINRLARPFHCKGRDLFLSASIGIAISPDDSDDAETLVKNADMAMYKAKDDGRCCFHFFNEEMETLAKSRTLLEWDLRRALEKEELVIYYQPIVSLDSLQTVTLEALIRWNHPEPEFLLPEHFIPLAEESILISKIGEWVLETACKQVATWRRRFQQDLSLAVNISGKQFNHSGILSIVLSALKKSQLPAEALILELTESLMFNPVNDMKEHLTDLKQSGVQLSIDDFGTGYSSLSKLWQYPFDSLKIDKSFVLSVASEEKKQSLVKAMVRIGQSMNIKVIAEGVEGQRDLAYLQDIGCDEAQGYYFSQPLSAEAYEAVLEKGG